MIESGFVVYKMRSQDVYLEYNDEKYQWQVKSGEFRGSSCAWMYVSSVCVAPHQVTNVARVWNGQEFKSQVGVEFGLHYDNVLIAGCSGTVAQQVNGVFEPTSEKFG